LLVLKHVEDAEWSLRCARSDYRLGAVRRGKTMHIGLTPPRGTLLIPPEEGSESRTHAEEPLDYWVHRLESSGEQRTQVVERAACTAAAELDCPDVVERDVL
jgi:hypothetical protein